MSHISSITTGFYAKPDPIAQVKYLQVNHFSDTGRLDNMPFPELEFNDKTSRHILHENDVLFAAKGARNFATIISSEFGLAVAASSFFIIRLKPEAKSLVLPTFLTWSLNHPTIMGYLKDNAIGSSVPSISKATLETLLLDIPPIQTQKMIIEITELYKKETELKAQIESLKNKQLNQIMLNALKHQ